MIIVNWNIDISAAMVGSTAQGSQGIGMYLRMESCISWKIIFLDQPVSLEECFLAGSRIAADVAISQSWFSEYSSFAETDFRLSPAWISYG